MLGFGQGHLDRHLLVAPERAQSALPPPPCGASAAFSHQRPTARVHHASATKTQQEQGHAWDRRLLLLLLFCRRRRRRLGHVFNSVYGHNCDTTVTETYWCQVTWESRLLATRAPSRAKKMYAERTP